MNTKKRHYEIPVDMRYYQTKQAGIKKIDISAVYALGVFFVFFLDVWHKDQDNTKMNVICSDVSLSF